MPKMMSLVAHTYNLSTWVPARGTERKLANGRDIKAGGEEWTSRDAVCSLVSFSHVASCRTEAQNPCWHDAQARITIALV